MSPSLVDEMESLMERLHAAEHERSIWTVYDRIRREFDPWVYKYQDYDSEVVTDLMNKIDLFNEYLNEFLSERYDFWILSDGLIQFEKLTGINRSIIGGLPVVVFHHGSDAIRKKVEEEGLRPYGDPGVKRSCLINTTTRGVYVTSEQSGRMASHYSWDAVRAYAGRPYCWSVRTTIAELAQDPDDLDMPWTYGRQFVLPYVDPENIV